MPSLPFHPRRYRLYGARGIRQGGKNALYTVVTQCTIAWLVAFVVHLVGTMLGFH